MAGHVAAVVTLADDALVAGHLLAEGVLAAEEEEEHGDGGVERLTRGGRSRRGGGRTSLMGCARRVGTERPLVRALARRRLDAGTTSGGRGRTMGALGRGATAETETERVAATTRTGSWLCGAAYRRQTRLAGGFTRAVGSG